MAAGQRGTAGANLGRGASLLHRARGVAGRETLLLGCFEDVRSGLELYGDGIARRLDIHLLAKQTVYCTWYHARAFKQPPSTGNSRSSTTRDGREG